MYYTQKGIYFCYYSINLENLNLIYIFGIKISTKFYFELFINSSLNIIIMIKFYKNIV